jgi:hypothetical protein
MKNGRLVADLRRQQQQVNELLREEAVRLRLGTKESVPRLEAFRARGDMAEFSAWCEREFCEYIRRQVERGPRSSGLLINDGARLLGISPATAKRYMGKLRAKGGPFAGLGDVVILNPRYQPRETDEYWQDVQDADVSPEGDEQE